jgi:hypothetical protein
MSHRGFSLRFLFAITTLLAFMGWAVGSPSEFSCLAVIGLWSLAGAVWGWMCDGRRLLGTVKYGAAGAAASVVTFIACFWPIFLIGYFFYDGQEEYFEDGFFEEAFIYPVVYCVVYVPMAALVGSAVGFGVWAFGILLTTQRAPASVADPRS